MKKYTTLLAAFAFLFIGSLSNAQCPTETICINEGDPEVFIGFDRKDWTANFGDLSEGYLCTFELEEPDCECVLIDQITIDIDWTVVFNDIDANIATPTVPDCYLEEFVNLGLCEDTGPRTCDTDEIFKEGPWPFGGLTFTNGPIDFSFGRFLSIDLFPLVTSACPNDRDVITQGFYAATFDICVEITYKADEPEDILDIPDEEEFCFDPLDLYEYDAPNDYEQYDWLDEDGDLISSSNQDEFEVPLPGTYTLVVTDEAGCTQEDIISFNDIPKPVITYSLPNPLVNCGNSEDTIRVSVNGSLGNSSYTYDWETPSGSNINNSSTLIPIDTGAYILTVEDRFFRCEFRDTFYVQTKQSSTAQIDSLSMPQRAICEGNSLELTAFVPYDDLEFYTFAWVNGLDTTRSQNFSLNRSGRYYLLMQDTLGCPATIDSIDVTVIQEESAGDDNATVACPSAQFNLDDYLVNNTVTNGAWIDVSNSLVIPGSIIDLTGQQGTRTFYYLVSNPLPCEVDTAVIELTFPVPLTCDDGDCNNGEEIWDASTCACITVNVPDPNTCVDDGDCGNGEEMWDVTICDCIQINIPDPSTCMDDGDCSNGIESWNPATCSCEVSTEILGCTDDTALNYDPNATCDDGSCNYNCPDPGNCDDGDCSTGEEVWDGTLCECVTINVPDPSTCVDDGDCSNGEEMWDAALCDCIQINIPDPSTCIDDGDCTNGIESWNPTTCSCEVSVEILGCTDNTALNYDPSATCDDGTCNYNCPDPGNCNDGDCSNGEEVWDGSLCECIAINIPDPTTCVDDGDCSNGEEMWDTNICDCIQINIPDPSTCIDDDDCTNGVETWNPATCSCEVSVEVLGCTDTSALNFDPNATCDDGSCNYNCPDPGNCDDGDCTNGEEVWDGSLCECIAINIPDPSTCVDDGDCSNGEEMWDTTICDCIQTNIPDPSTCIDDGNCANGEETWDNTVCDCIQLNVPDPSTCVDDGNCANGEETWDDTVCDCIQLNVPDPSTCIDDGDCNNGLETWNSTTCTCDAVVEPSGCTSPTALNYDPAATCEDGTCQWDCQDEMLNIGDPCDDGDTDTNNDRIDMDCSCAGDKSESKLYLPNIMSQDEFGNNEFQIFSSEDVLIIDFRIFDRWGNNVHSVSNVMSTDPSVTWRGTFNNTAVQQGVYLYRLEYQSGEDPEIQFGEITVLN